MVLATALACAPPSPDVEPPRLLVLIGIDQFRAGYLDRYDEVFVGGFRRLLDEGLRFDRAIVDHAPTLSYPGHATLATGAHPRTHGFTSNAWLETLPSGESRRVFVASDPEVEILGDPDQPGVSPRNLLVSGLADWIREDPEAEAVALSTGPALAMVYGGRALSDESRNHAYWLSSSQGRFVTSTYFRSEYPPWVRDFNSTVMPGSREQQVWDTSVPEAHRRLARPDDASFEGDGVHTAFPHRFGEGSDAEGVPDYDPEEVDAEGWSRWFFDTPLADEALFALAVEAIDAMRLGQRGTTDLLALAVKSVDRIGHDYGPRSQEQLDVLVRLDRLLGVLFDHLDAVVGEDAWAVALSADHGAPNIAEYELERGRPARRVSEQDLQDLLDDIEATVAADTIPDDELPAAIAKLLETYDFIGRAMTPDELAGSGPGDAILRAYRNSFIPGRRTPFPLWTSEVLAGRLGQAHPAVWGIVADFAENAQLWTAPSAHGTAHAYDREVPILFMGRDIEPGVSGAPARTIDVAPTLAALAGLDVPASVDGAVLPVER